ncbi:ubiquitin-related domain-containing protein [Colletotrichum phormii]|uniref:Ubiquitin-related domain-containing protein n=1 Tax=Colletotrichum phormii TaxID=359342 RepID=A0AAJ0ECC7_9PEZI|nr:ubiquitin-related domain-containing protein [Colletotrichum phormii]KAK1633864.1 ubiquitin-related domain-containing protein [Colletotrichum phormii]
MTQSDLNQLLDMGFEKARAELAVKKTGNLNGALEWLETNQDKPLEELAAAAEAAKDDDDDAAEVQANIEALENGGTAKSLVCNECGKRFRSQDTASYHASKTDHTDFSESTEEIAPLTEDQKKEKLIQLREQLQEKNAKQALLDKEDAKRNEKIRMKATKETQEAKEELARKEQIKEAAKKRQEKQDDIEAKRRIKAKIEADKEERRRKAEEAKAAREGRAPEAPAAAAAPAAPKAVANHNEARLRLQTAGGNVVKTLPAETTLFEVAQMLQSETGTAVTSFSTTFPRKTFEGHMDLSKTLKEAGLTPSAVLIVK